MSINCKYVEPHTEQEKEEIKIIKSEYNLKKEKFLRYYCFICNNNTWSTHEQHIIHLQSLEHKTARECKKNKLKII